jgi:hypothetical protein
MCVWQTVATVLALMVVYPRQTSAQSPPGYSGPAVGSCTGCTAEKFKYNAYEADCKPCTAFSTSPVPHATQIILKRLPIRARVVTQVPPRLPVQQHVLVAGATQDFISGMTGNTYTAFSTSPAGTTARSGVSHVSEGQDRTSRKRRVQVCVR